MVIPPSITDWAREQSSTFLAPLETRWLHVQGVVERAYWVCALFDEIDRSYLIAAAYLHDIGYAPQLQQTGFHPSTELAICNPSTRID